PVSHSRRYELTVEEPIAVSAPTCLMMPPMQCRPIGPGLASPGSGRNVFSPPLRYVKLSSSPGSSGCPSLLTIVLPPRHSDRLWWQPEAETPMNGFVMKQAIRLNSRATWAQIWRYVVSRSAVRRQSSYIQVSSSCPGASSWSPWIISRPPARGAAPGEDTGAAAPVPGKLPEPPRVREADQVGRSWPVADVVAVTVDEQVRGGAVHELKAPLRGALPVVRRYTFADDAPGDG